MVSNVINIHVVLGGGRAYAYNLGEAEMFQTSNIERLKEMIVQVQSF